MSRAETILTEKKVKLNNKDDAMDALNSAEELIAGVETFVAKNGGDVGDAKKVADALKKASSSLSDAYDAL